LIIPKILEVTTILSLPNLFSADCAMMQFNQQTSVRTKHFFLLMYLYCLISASISQDNFWKYASCYYK